MKRCPSPLTSRRAPQAAIFVPVRMCEFMCLLLSTADMSIGYPYGSGWGAVYSGAVVPGSVGGGFARPPAHLVPAIAASPAHSFDHTALAFAPQLTVGTSAPRPSLPYSVTGSVVPPPPPPVPAGMHRPTASFAVPPPPHPGTRQTPETLLTMQVNSHLIMELISLITPWSSYGRADMRKLSVEECREILALRGLSLRAVAMTQPGQASLRPLPVDYDFFPNRVNVSVTPAWEVFAVLNMG
jgi:hypothetical protein